MKLTIDEMTYINGLIAGIYTNYREKHSIPNHFIREYEEASGTLKFEVFHNVELNQRILCISQPGAQAPNWLQPDRPIQIVLGEIPPQTNDNIDPYCKRKAVA